MFGFTDEKCFKLIKDRPSFLCVVVAAKECDMGSKVAF